MKHVKSFLALVLALMLVCGMAVVPAFAAGELVGDAKIFMPSTGAVKVQYTLTSDGTTKVDGATYAITKVENADDSQVAAEDIWKYAQIDPATGDLYVSQAAKGKEIFISATGGEYSGSKSIVVSEVSYGTDFEDGVIPSFITNGDRVSVATDATGNKFAPFLAAKWGDTNATVIDLAGANFATNHLTVEMKFKSTGESNRNANADTGVVASYWNPTYPLQVVYDQTFVGRKSYGSTSDTTYTVTAKWTTGKGATANTAKVLFTDYYKGTASATNNGVYEAANKEVVAYTYTGSYTPNSGTARDGGFSDDFEFISMKAQIINDRSYTTVNGVTGDRYFVDHFAEASVKEANIAKIILGAPIDDLEIYTGEKASNEIFAAYKMEGLDKLYLPSAGTAKVSYVAKDKNGAAVVGATYSISGDSDLATYALMDATTGEMLINSAAVGKTINVTATIGEESVTKTITTDRIYVDFENEIVGNTVADAIFSTKTATVVANGSGKAASSTGASGSDTSTYGLAISLADFNYPSYTIEANIGSAGSATLVALKQSGAPAVTRYFTEAGTGTRNLCYKGNATAWGADTRGAAFNYTEGAYYPLTLKVTDYYKVVANWNTVSIGTSYLYGHNSSSTEAAYTQLDSVAFGAMVDDIQIYNVDKAAGAYSITGQTGISRAPIGTSAKFAYKAQPTLPWATGEDLSWGIAGSYEGVSVDAVTGVVTVAGSAATGTFTLQLKEAGSVVATKDVKIINASDQWCFDMARTFLDFENQGDYIGKAPVTRIKYTTGQSSSNYNDIPLTFERNGQSSLTKEEGLVTGVIQQEANGNLYVTALGSHWWSNAGSTFRFYPYGLKNRTWLSGAESATLEADFMIESKYMSTRLNETYSLFSENTASNSSAAGASDIELLYRYFADGTAGIYVGHWDTDDNGDRYTIKRLVGVVNTDEWFNVRLELNFVAKNYDLYVNNQKLAVGEAILKDHVECFFVGAAIDNIAVYHGAKAVDEVALTTTFKDGVEAISGASFATGISINDGGTKTLSVTLGEAAPANITDDARLIIARYNAGKLIKMTSVPVSVVNGKLYGCAALTAEYAAGDTVKAFLWNWGTMQPVK